MGASHCTYPTKTTRNQGPGSRSLLGIRGFLFVWCNALPFAMFPLLGPVRDAQYCCLGDPQAPGLFHGKSPKTMDQWPFQEPIDWRYLPYIRPIVQAYVREHPHKIWPYMVQYLHFRILKFPLNNGWKSYGTPDFRNQTNFMISTVDILSVESGFQSR